MVSLYKTGYFIVVKSNYSTVGVDFFQQHKLTVDFSQGTIHIFSVPTTTPIDNLQCIWQSTVKCKPLVCDVAATQDALDVTTDSAIPDYGSPK